MFDWMILSREQTLRADWTGRGIRAGIVFTLVTETEINNYFGSLEVGYPVSLISRLAVPLTTILNNK